MAQRRLPSNEDIAVMLQTRTRQHIAAQYGVTPQAVSNCVRRHKIPTPSRGALPWTLTPQDQDHTFAQYLRALRRHHRGTARTGDRTVSAARTWAQTLADTEQAVTYDPHFGFRLVPVQAASALHTTCITPQP